MAEAHLPASCLALDSFQHLSAFVGVVVVAGTQQRQVVQIGGAVVSEPFIQVVGLTPTRGPVAAGPHAATVAHDEGTLLGCGYAVAPAANVEWLGAAAQDHRDDSRVTCQVSCAGDRTTRKAPIGDGIVYLASQPDQIHGDNHLGSGSGPAFAVGRAATALCPPCHLDERIGAALHGCCTGGFVPPHFVGNVFKVSGTHRGVDRALGPSPTGLRCVEALDRLAGDVGDQVEVLVEVEHCE